jgi:drug/metabolite transporter (DMT)-like permease
VVYFYLLLQQLIGSTTHLVAQDATQSVDPGLLLLLRSSGAATAFFVLLMVMERRWNVFHRIAREDIGRLFLLGLLNVPLNQMLYLYGIKYTTPENSALLYSLTPALVFLFTAIRHSERPSGKKALGIAIALIGAVIVMFDQGAELAPKHTMGNILIFIAVIAWSLFTMLGRPLVLKYGAVYVTAVNMIFGALLYLPFGLLTSHFTDLSGFSGTSWTEVCYLILFASVLNYILWYAALSRLEATRVAVFQNLQPIITTALALYFGRTVLTLQFVGGGSLALIGVLVVELA